VVQVIVKVPVELQIILQEQDIFSFTRYRQEAL
jgi:hypothetical protein